MAIEASSMYLNPGGYVKVYPPVAPLLISAVAGNSICLNGDFHVQYLGRPYPKVRKAHDLPLNSNGITFFTNFREPYADLAVSFYSLEGMVLSTEITAVLSPVGDNYFVDVSVGVVRDYTQFVAVFYKTSDSLVVGVSTTFVTMPLGAPNVARVDYRTARGKIQAFPYPDDLDDRYNSILMFANMKGYEYPEDRTVYFEVSTGRTRKNNSLLKRTVTLETYYMDFATHEGVAVIFHHEDVKIHGRVYVSEEQYNPNSEADKDLTSGTINLSDSQFSTRLNGC